MRVFSSSTYLLVFVISFCSRTAITFVLGSYTPHTPPHKDIPSARAGFTVITFFVPSFCYYFLAKCLLFAALPSSNITTCFLCLAFRIFVCYCFRVRVFLSRCCYSVFLGYWERVGKWAWGYGLSKGTEGKGRGGTNHRSLFIARRRGYGVQQGVWKRGWLYGSEIRQVGAPTRVYGKEGLGRKVVTERGRLDIAGANERTLWAAQSLGGPF